MPLLVLAACVAGRVRTDEPIPADGRFAGTLGLAAGSGKIVCTACTHAGTMGGPTLTLQVAGRVGSHLGIGGTSDWWSHSEDDWARGVWSINAVLFFYSGSARRGFFIGGGPSYSQMVAWMTDTTGLQRHGWGITAEMGYDIRVKPTTSLTPFVEYTSATVGDIYYPLHSTIPWARGWKHRVLSVGLGMTFHERRKE